MVVAKVFLRYYTLHAACYCTDIYSCRMYIVQQNSSVPAPVCTIPFCTFTPKYSYLYLHQLQNLCVLLSVCTCTGYMLVPVSTSCYTVKIGPIIQHLSFIYT
jgi:hypothetical protein